MGWYNNLKISTKLLTGFILVALIAAAVGVVGIYGMNQIDASTNVLIENRLPSIKELSTIKEAQTAILAGERFLINRRLMDTETRQSNYEFIDSAIERAEGAWEKYEQLPQTEEEAKAWAEFTSEWSQWLKEHQKITDGQKKKDELIASGVSTDDDKIAAIDNETLQLSLSAREQYLAASNTIDNLININNAAADKDAAAADQSKNRYYAILIVTVIIGVLLALSLGILISRIITHPIRSLTNAAEKLSIGDVNIDITANTKDELGLLMESFAKMVANIREQADVVDKIASGDLTSQINVKSKEDLLGIKLDEMLQMNNEALRNIHSAAEQVAMGAKQMSDTSLALSEGATEQASSVEELTASIEQISAQTQQNAEYANQANGLAETAKSNAVKGNSQMEEMLKAMQDINESSSNISKIIKVIDEIAFQTNILALNAAVEAARAGQHGKGFAVVAEEVRNLAARSANAAKETTDMIEGSIKKVDYGTRITNETAAALAKIVENITKVAGLVDNIATASNEQALGISQVSQGIMQVSQVVQTNSATAEESAAVSEELSSQAELLKDQVNRFQLKKDYHMPNYKNLDNSEVLKVLESMKHSKFNDTSEKFRGHSQKAGSQVKINLDDKEFGKY